jgi:hypothetical protein
MTRLGVPEAVNSATPDTTVPLQRRQFDDFALTACWLGGPQATLGEFADEADRFLTRLVALHSMFAGMYLVGDSRKDSPRLAADLSNLRSWVLRRTWHEGAPTNARYSHQQADGSLTWQSRGDMGFSLSLSNLQSPDRSLRVNVSGGFAEGGSVKIDVPPNMADAFCSPDFIRRLLSVLCEVWPVRYAWLSSLSWDDNVNAGLQRRESLPIGGITYSSDCTLVEGLPHGTDWEALGSGGVVFKVTSRPDRLEPESVARAIAIRESLVAHGMLALRNQHCRR